MPSLVFKPVGKTTPLKAGLVLARKLNNRTTYERITHVFSTSVYVMTIGDPADVHDARRPARLRRVKVEADRKAGSVVMGRVTLPSEFTASVESGSEDDQKIEAAMEAIRPLVALFENEANLDRTKFTLHIAQRAGKLGRSETTIKRILFRYWYFGGVKNALLHLGKGPVPSSKRSEGPAVDQTAGKRSRRGRRADLCADLGDNEFIVAADDIADMVHAVAREARNTSAATSAGTGALSVPTIHRSYLHHEFKDRHPKIYKKWIAGKHVPPLSESQFRRYIKAHESLDDDLRHLVPALDHERTDEMLQSSGPGDVYELDATGGQIVLVDKNYPGTVLARPVIYLLIDRWSRYVLSIYITLLSPSWEALRIALRIAFTSRSPRFKNLGYPVSDEDWIVGVPPARMAVDRGSDMISERMLEAAVDGLLIEPMILPPLTPDGKAIVETAIRILKKDLKATRVSGQYDKNTLDPKKRRAKKAAKVAAVYSLAELYRALITIVMKRNNVTVHKWLKSRSILKVNGVPPRPRDAYVWGLENLTGIQRPPLTDDDYRRLTLGVADATLHGSIMTYRGRHYRPSNPAAHKFLRTAKDKKYKVRIDRSQPDELYLPGRTNDWPSWKIDRAGASDLESITLEEQQSLSQKHRIVVARAENDALRTPGEPLPKGRPVRRQEPVPSAKPQTQAARNQRRRQISEELNAQLDGIPPPKHGAGRRQRPGSITQRDESEGGLATAVAVAELERQRRARLVEETKRRRK